MIIGFTGTRKGMTNQQKQSVLDFLDSVAGKEPIAARHGGCIGADADFSELWHEEFRYKRYAYVYVHPSNIKSQQDRKAIEYHDELWSELPPLDRNRIIVDQSDMLLACPKSDKEELRSGTWATIRYARKHNKPITIIYPSGKMASFGTT